MQMIRVLCLLLLVRLSCAKMPLFKTDIHFLKDFIDKMDQDNIMIIVDEDEGDPAIMIIFTAHGNLSELQNTEGWKELFIQVSWLGKRIFILKYPLRYQKQVFECK